MILGQSQILLPEKMHVCGIFCVNKIWNKPPPFTSATDKADHFEFLALQSGMPDVY